MKTNGHHNSGGHSNRIQNHLSKKGTAMKTNSKNKVKEAMNLLNEAAREEISKKIGSKYSRLKEAVEDGAQNAQYLAKRAQKNITRKIHQKEKDLKEAAAELDRKVRKNPWAVVGAAAAGTFVAGLVIGSGRRKKKSGEKAEKLSSTAEKVSEKIVKPDAEKKQK